MCRPTIQASPSRTVAYARARSALPLRSDFTSDPVSTNPASWRSSRWYSCRALRFSAISFSPAAIRSIVAATDPELDLPFRPVDVGDGDLDRVAEPEGPFRAPPDESGGELVDLVVVPAQSADRDVALEDLSEADEEAGADDAVDLAWERRVPAALEEHGLEQPGKADVVGAVLDVREPALLGGRMVGSLPEILGKGLVGRAELPQERPVDDQVGIAPDRRREVSVRRAGEARVTEVARVVSRLLQRPEDERREGLGAATRPPDVIRDALARLRGELRGETRRQALPVGRRRSRHLECRELREQVKDGLRVGPLVDAVERFPPPSRQQSTDRLVGEDHQLLHEHVRVRLGLEPGAIDAAVLVEGECDLPGRHAERAAGKAAAAQVERNRFGQPEPLGDLRLGALFPAQDPLRLPVRQPRSAADHRPVERRPAELQVRVEGHLDGDAEAIFARAQAAQIVRELRRQHRRHAAGHVQGEGALRRPAVERGAGGDEVRNVGDVHPDAITVSLPADRDRVVEVLRRVGVDRERDLPAKVDPAVEARGRRVVRLEVRPRTLLLEQRLEDVRQPVCGPHSLLDPGPPSPGPDDGELPGADVAQPALVQRQRHARREVRLADEETPAPSDLDDEAVGQTLRKRRSVRPEPAAPSSSPRPRRIKEISQKPSACTSGSLVRRGSSEGSAASLLTKSRITASSEPTRPQIKPSSMNGPRTNQFVAPTSFITSISRRRAKIERRIVFAIRIAAAERSTRTAIPKMALMMFATRRIRFAFSFPYVTLWTPSG